MPGLLVGLRELLLQQPQWQAMGNAARAHVEQHFALRVVAQRLMDVYQRL
jgi:glycosyltransferase involved in cell wall biosynthesis